MVLGTRNPKVMGPSGQDTPRPSHIARLQAVKSSRLPGSEDGKGLGPTWTTNLAFLSLKMVPKWSQNGSKISPKWENAPKLYQNGSKIAPKWETAGYMVHYVGHFRGLGRPRTYRELQRHSSRTIETAANPTRVPQAPSRDM